MDTPKKIGRYEILEELGHGAMGTVYRAKDPAMDRVVALKTIIALVLSSDQGSDFRERFYREARAAGALAHPGIVPVFDVGEHEGLPFLVMEFISGKTLADAMKKGERMTLDRVCELGQKIAEALGYAHQHGVVHRDIKPANILLTSKEAHGIERPKITDFGVAKLAAGTYDAYGADSGDARIHAPGTIHRGSDRRARGHFFPGRGAVLDGDRRAAVSRRKHDGGFLQSGSHRTRAAAKLNPSIPLKLEGIILKCLAKNPDERYQTGEDLARDLGELRTVSTSMGLKSAAPEVAADGSDPNATYIETPAPTQAGRTAAPLPTAPVVAPKSNSNNLLVLAALVVVVIVAGSWYMLRHKGTPAVQATPPPSAVASEAPPATPPAPPATNVPAAAKPAATAPKKPETKVAAAEKAPPPKAGIPAPKAEAATPEPAAVDFNPKSLDPEGKRAAEDRSRSDARGPGFYSGNEWEALFAEKRRGK